MAKAPFDLKGRRIFVAGHRGMVGGALVRRLASEGVELQTVTRSEVDLRDQAAVLPRQKSVASSPTIRCGPNSFTTT
jgi:nucleoside-diphosphate-sugar epimerase